METFEEIKSTFDLLGGWENKYEYLVDLGRKLPDMPAELKIDKYKIAACSSPTWLYLTITVKGLDLQTDSTSQIIKGVLYIVKTICSGKTLQECNKINAIELLNSLGLLTNITASRYNGIQHVILHLKRFCAGNV